MAGLLDLIIGKLSSGPIESSTPMTNTPTSPAQVARNLITPYSPAPGQTAGTFAATAGKEIPEQLAEKVGRPAIRAYAALSSFFGKPLTPTGQFQQDVYGTDKPITLTSVGRETLGQDPNEATKGLGKLVFPAVGLLAAGADLVPGGEEVNALARRLARLGKAVDTAKELKKTLPGLGETERTLFAERYAGMTDAKAIEEDLNRTLMAGGSSPRVSAPDVPGGAASRPQLPTTGETPATRPQVRPFQPAEGPVGSSEIASNPVYRALFEDPTSVGETVRKAWLKTIEYLQDSSIRVKKLMEVAKENEDLANIYQKQTLYPGRVGARVEEGKRIGEQVFQNLAKEARATGTTFDSLRKDVQDFLVSRHAPERNAALGQEKAAGITDAEAAATQRRLQESPHYVAIKKAADELQALHNRTLELLRDSQVISKDLYQTLRERYPNHVPLQRVMEDTPDFAGALTGTGYDVRSTGIKSAKGSTRQVSDIVGNILYNHEQAVLRSEKNVVDLATLRFVRSHPEFDRIFSIEKPRATGTDFAGKPILEHTNDPQIIQLYENGKRVWIRVADPHLAIALRGVGREKIGPFLNAIASFSRLYSGLQTRFNPEFFAPNKIRDLQEVLVYVASQKGAGAKTALGTLKRDPESIKAVTDFIRGKDTPGARAYAELKRAGGTTGGFGLSTRKNTEIDVEDMVKNVTKAPRRTAKALINGVDNLNTVFEDSTRLSVYRAARANGMSEDQAAALAKEASINFNRMGNGGPVINGLWMFANASIQGSAKMLRAMKNPKVAAATATSVAASVAAVSAYNDQVDPAWRDKVTAWDRMNGLNIMLGTGDKITYVSIPVSWGLKPMKVLADYLYDGLSGHKVDPTDAAGKFFTSIVEGYNPVGGTDVVSAITPTILDIPVEIARNQQWSGAKIRPDYDKNAPPSTQYFPSLRDKATGRLAADATRNLAHLGIEISPANIVYAYDQLVGGAGRTVTKTANTLWGIKNVVTGQGDLPPVNEWPMISRFYRARDATEAASRTRKTEDINKLESEVSRKNFYLNQQAADTMKELEKLPTNAARADRLKQINQENPALAKKVLEDIKDKAAGLTADERRLKSATVDTRARLIMQEVDGLDPAERTRILKNYAAKNILTKSVLQRIAALRKQ